MGQENCRQFGNGSDVLRENWKESDLRSTYITWMRRVAGIATLAAFALSAGAASAYTVNGNWIATDYVTGFPQPSDPNSAGPIGLAFDASGNLLVTDINSGTLHRVPPGGGTAAGTL